MAALDRRGGQAGYFSIFSIRRMCCAAARSAAVWETLCHEGKLEVASFFLARLRAGKRMRRGGWARAAQRLRAIGVPMIPPILPARPFGPGRRLTIPCIPRIPRRVAGRVALFPAHWRAFAAFIPGFALVAPAWCGLSARSCLRRCAGGALIRAVCRGGAGGLGRARRYRAGVDRRGAASARRGGFAGGLCDGGFCGGFLRGFAGAVFDVIGHGRDPVRGSSRPRAAAARRGCAGRDRRGICASSPAGPGVRACRGGRRRRSSRVLRAP